MALFAPDNDELGSKEFDPVSGVRCDHKRGLSGGRYEIEDWRRDGGRLRDEDTAQLCKWWYTGSDGEDVGEVSKQVVGGAVGERSPGTEIDKLRGGPEWVRGSSGGRGIAAWIGVWVTRGDGGGGETWNETL